MDLLHGHFFFVDIVGLSDPNTSTKNQIKKIKVLNNSIGKCEAFKTISKEQLIVLPAGDGMAMGFLQGPELPLQLAIQLQKILNKQNKSKIPSETIQVRIGLNSGPVFVVNDVQNNKNVWGPGIIMARRIMDIGDDEHILMSSSMAHDLMGLSDNYKKMIYPLHDYTFKHGSTMLLYTVYGKGFGNSKLPTKGLISKSKARKEIREFSKNVLYSMVKLEMVIKNAKTMLVHHKRTYEIINNSAKSINHVLHGITTDIKKESLRELKLSVYEQGKKEMKISSISLDKPYHKEFTTEFNGTIKKNETRKYTIEYFLEEPKRYMENIFLVDCDKFYFKLTYPQNKDISPKLFEIEQESMKKKKIHTDNIKNKISNTVWEKKDIKQGEIIRVEW